MATKQRFPLVFANVKRDPNDRQIDNILDRKPGEYKQNNIAELMNKVDTGTNIDFNSALNRYISLDIKIDPNDFPKYATVKLGYLVVDEDINRELVVPHVTSIYAFFDAQRSQAIQTIKTPGKEEYTIVNGLHTSTSIALIVSRGQMLGWKAKDWKKFPVQVGYIETLDRSKARETFALLNGEMSIEISKFDHWKQHYLSVVLDQSGNPKYLRTYQWIELLKKYGCIPLPENHADSGLPGACTHLAAVETTGREDLDKLEFILACRDKYWNSQSVDSTEFGFYGSLLDLTDDNNIKRTGPDWNNFMEDIHAVVQKAFDGMSKLRLNVKKAYKNYRYDQFADRSGSAPFTLELYVAYKVYKTLGGKFDIPSLNNLYVNKNIDVINYLDQTKINYINQHLTKTKLKYKPVVIPTVKKVK
jgi:hypothetical protein